MNQFFSSFRCSIHSGPLNLSVIQTNVQKGLFASLLLAFGGVIPEIINRYLSAEGVIIFQKYPSVFQWMQWAVVPILLGLGIQEVIASRQSNQILKNTRKSGQTASKESSTLGSIHSGSIHSGSIHSGSIHSGSIHSGILYRSFQPSIIAFLDSSLTKLSKL